MSLAFSHDSKYLLAQVTHFIIKRYTITNKKTIQTHNFLLAEATIFIIRVNHFKDDDDDGEIYIVM